MSPSAPVHEITLGGVRASIWEERRMSRQVRESDFSVSIGRPDDFESRRQAGSGRSGRSVPPGRSAASGAGTESCGSGGSADRQAPPSADTFSAADTGPGTESGPPIRFGVEDLPLVAQVMDLAHLWIHQQSVGV
jgi:hypothetical protein